MTSFSIKNLITRFNKAVSTYEDCAVIQKRMANDLLERLPFFNIEPNTILNLGCGLAQISHSIKTLYPHSTLLNLDFAEKMLLASDSRHCENNNHPILADSHYLPLQNDSVEIIISNAMLPWSYDIMRLFAECKRVLKNDGLFLFTTLGPETLQQWQQAWQRSFPARKVVNGFIDMHDLADALMQAGLSHPVMDKEVVQINYSSMQRLINDLKGMGSTLTHASRYKGLSTANQWRIMKENYPKLEDNTYPLCWEVINGHCFNAPPKPPKYQQPFAIPVENIVKL